MKIFRDITTYGLEPDTFSYSLMIKGFKNSKSADTKSGLSLFKEYLHTHKLKETVVFNSLLDLLISTGH